MKLSTASRTYLKGYETGGKMVGKKLVVLPKGQPALKTYVDDVGVKTIGWGHTGWVNDKPLAMSTTITWAEAEELLSMDLADAEHAVTVGVGSNPTTQNQFDAMVLLTFNIGVAAFAKSTVLKRHNAGNYTSAAAMFALWNKGTVGGKKVVLNGLTRRRAEEASIYGSETKIATPKPLPKPVAGAPLVAYDQDASKRATPVAPDKLSKSPTIIGGAIAALTSVPITVQTVTTATESLKQVKEQAEQIQQLAWLSSALGVILFILATYVIWKRWKDHNEGVK